MTNEERLEALSIIQDYNSMNDRLREILETIETLEGKSNETLRELEKIKDREKAFMESYKEKYGSVDILADLNSISK